MVENISKLCEMFSTVLFFCKKTGKTFDFFSQQGHGKLYSSKENKEKQTWPCKSSTNKNVIKNVTESVTAQTK